MLRDHPNKWKQKHTSFWWKPLCTSHSFFFLKKNFSRVVGGSLSYLRKFLRGGGGGAPFPGKKGKSWEVGGSWVKFPPWWGSGYFLELHNVGRIADFVDWNVQHDTGTLVQESSFFSKTAFRTKFNLYNWNLWIILIYKDTSSAQIYYG